MGHFSSRRDPSTRLLRPPAAGFGRSPVPAAHGPDCPYGMAETAAMSRRWLLAYSLVNILLWPGIWAVNHFDGPTWLGWTLISHGLSDGTGARCKRKRMVPVKPVS